MSTPSVRFFLDHCVIHDRKTSRHLGLDDPQEIIEMLNALDAERQRVTDAMDSLVELNQLARESDKG